VLLLSFVAGYVDTCTFLALFGLFVAQVTGSFVVTGTELVLPEPGFLLKVLAIPIFVLAAAATAVLVSMMPAARYSGWPLVLGLEAALLIAFLLIGLTDSPFVGPDQPAAVAAGLCGLAAMGVQSAAVRLLGHGAPSTNVMTTNTTQLAIDAAQLMMARFRGMSADQFLSQAEIGKTRQRLGDTVRVMLGFLVGVVVGAPAFRSFGFICLAPVIGVLLCVAVAVVSGRSHA
jgi:uncharacterized membrane protein YoaK (UPF0700 family)